MHISPKDASTPSPVSVNDRIKFENVVVFKNANAGSAGDIEHDLNQIMNDRGHARPRHHVLTSADFETEMKDGIEAETDLLICYGGDGTCRAAANVAREHDLLLIALPGGTMNVLPRALYGTADWGEALNIALDSPRPRWLARGTLNTKPFYVAAIVGTASRMADVREAVRDGHVIDAIKSVPKAVQSLTDDDTFELAFEHSAEKLNAPSGAELASIVMLSCPNMSSGASEKDSFEAAYAGALSPQELVDIGAHTLLGDWRDSKDVTIKFTKGCVVESGPQTTDLPRVLLDGEASDFRYPLNIVFEQQGVRVLAPMGSLLEAK